MIVTKVMELSQSRSKIYIDQEFAFVLYKGELRHYRIEEGQEIAEAAIREIREEILPKRAKLRCLNLLKSREYTEKQLQDKLKQGLYPLEVIDVAINYVKSYRYVDDASYTKRYLSCHMERKSKLQMEQELYRKGIGKEAVREAFSALEEDGMCADEHAMVQELLRKRHYDAATADRKEKQRTGAYLLRKGFSMDVIRKVLSFSDVSEDCL